MVKTKAHLDYFYQDLPTNILFFKITFSHQGKFGRQKVHTLRFYGIQSKILQNWTIKNRGWLIQATNLTVEYSVVKISKKYQNMQIG